MKYIIDIYNQWDPWDREHSIYTFQINGVWYAIKEVIVEEGILELPMRFDRDLKQEWYAVYDRAEDALGYIAQLKMLN